jgi:hypothetical protein
MSCILRVSGDKLDIDSLVKKIKIKPYDTYKKGEPVFKTKPEGRKVQTSGMSFCTSNADSDKVDKQIKDTIKYLTKNKLELKKVTTNKNVTYSTLDFAVELRMGYNNIALQSDYFPHELLKLCADLKIDLGFSLYPPDLEEQMEARLAEKKKLAKKK